MQVFCSLPVCCALEDRIDFTLEDRIDFINDLVGRLELTAAECTKLSKVDDAKFASLQ